MDEIGSRQPTILSSGELEVFQELGFVRVSRAFEPDLARGLAAEVWLELREEHGIEREDPSTWRAPPHGPRRAKVHALNDGLDKSRLSGAISDLLGRDDWRRPRTWGGFLVNFPSAEAGTWDIPDDAWHWDGHPLAEGLLIFSFYSSVEHGGGGTLLVERSQRVVEDFYASLSAHEQEFPHRAHRKLLLRSDPWLAELSSRSHTAAVDRIERFQRRSTSVHGFDCRVVELTGAPGDAVFCNLGMIHSPAPNCASVPRLMRSKFLFLGPHFLTRD